MSGSDSGGKLDFFPVVCPIRTLEIVLAQVKRLWRGRGWAFSHTPTTMIAATSSFAGVQVTKAVAAPKASGRSALVVEARRTKASAPSRSAAKVKMP